MFLLWVTPPYKTHGSHCMFSEFAKIENVLFMPIFVAQRKSLDIKRKHLKVG